VKVKLDVPDDFRDWLNTVFDMADGNTTQLRRIADAFDGILTMIREDRNPTPRKGVKSRKGR